MRSFHTKPAFMLDMCLEGATNFRTKGRVSFAPQSYLENGTVDLLPYTQPWEFDLNPGEMVIVPFGMPHQAILLVWSGMPPLPFRFTLTAMPHLPSTCPMLGRKFGAQRCNCWKVRYKISQRSTI